jgi:ABC-type glycerol-3-phosphate transport system permease component
MASHSFHPGTNVKLSKIIFVAVLLLLFASLLKAKTLTVLLLANAFRSLIEAKLVPTSSWPGKTDSAPLFKTGVTALIIPPAATATGTFMMRQYMVGIPDEMLEDARIDGASDWKIYRHVMLPFVGSGAGAVGILSFTWRWNDYLWPLIVINNQQTYTVQLSLSNLIGTNTVEWGTLLAYATLVMVPALIVFLCFQRYFLKGSLSGGVKG